MRVTIEHREQSAGLTGSKRHYFVDCTVIFSEEEKAIIKQRALFDQSITVESDIPTTGNVVAESFVGNVGSRMLARLLVLAGIVGAIWSAIDPITVPGGIPFALFLTALAIFIYRKYAERRSDNSLSERQITVRRLLKDPQFTVFADTPVLGQAYEERIRQQLVSLKNQIAASAEVPKKQTFEL